MKNGIRVSCLIFYCFILVAFTFSSCRTKKNISRAESTQTTVQAVESKTDTSRVITQSQSNTDEEKVVRETTTRETVAFDTLGRISSIVRENIETQTGQRWIHRGSGSTVSLTGLTTVTENRSDSLFQQSETDKSTTDSRPVQGSEWLWVIISAALILAVIIYILYNKFKKTKSPL